MMHGFLTVFSVVERENLVEFFISPKVSTIQFEYFLALLNDHVSQAAACDGNKYQVVPNDSHLSYIPGVLPL